VATHTGVVVQAHRAAGRRTFLANEVAVAVVVVTGQQRLVRVDVLTFEDGPVNRPRGCRASAALHIFLDFLFFSNLVLRDEKMKAAPGCSNSKKTALVDN
jgi:hypothetical protein